MKRIQYIIPFLLLSIIVNAQLSQSVDITPKGFSGDFKQIVYSKNQGLIALADNGYLYESSDTGKTWIPKLAPFAGASQMRMGKDGMIGYLFNDDTLFHTANGGKTWSKMITIGIPETLDGYKMFYVNIFHKNEDTLFIITTNLVNGLKFYMSSDKGLNWKLVAQNMSSPNLYNYISSIHFATPLHGYAFGQGYYAETTDGGNSWTKHLFFKFVEQIIQVYSFTNGKAVLYYENSDDKIQSINTSLDGNPLTKVSVQTTIDRIISFQGFNEKIYAIGLDGHLYKSLDSAKTWTQTIIASSMSGSVILKGAYFYNDQVGVIVGRNLCSYVTLDGGTTWKKYVHGGAEGFEKIYCKTKNECFITGTTGRLFHTKDGGNTWDWQDIHNGNLQEIEFPTPDTGYIVGPEILFRTIDGGESWIGIPNSSNAGLIEFPTKDIGYMGYSSLGSFIYKSENAGETWDIYANSLYMNNKNRGGGVSFRTELEGLVCANMGKLLYTNDGANTWQVKSSINANSKAYDIMAMPNKKWLVLGIETTLDNTEIYVCDENINCTQTYFIEKTGGDFRKINNSTYAYMHQDSIFISKDYGVTWEGGKNTGGFLDYYFVNSNVEYSIDDYKIHKGYYGNTITLDITKLTNRSYTLNAETAEPSIQATIYLKDNLGVLHQLATAVTLQNGVGYTVIIPKSVAIGNYTIYIEPVSSAYIPVESNVIVIDQDNALQPLSKSECYTITAKTLTITTQKPITVYNIMGVQVPIYGNQVKLQQGMYIIKSECGVEKIMIK